MLDKFEEQRIANRLRGIWAILIMLIGVTAFFSVSPLGNRILMIFLAVLIAGVAIAFIIWITKKEK